MSAVVMDFSAQATEIKKYLKSKERHNGFFPRPFMVEFGGTPSAGKTTLITQIDTILRREGLRVYCPQEGAQAIRHISRHTPLYNLRTGIYALSILIDLAHSSTYDVILFDRCIFDSYHWMIHWERKGMLTSETKAMFQSFFMSPYWANMIDVAYLMVCAPEAALKRETKVQIAKKFGNTTNPDAIQNFNKQYRDAQRELRAMGFKQVRLLETTKLGIPGMVRKVADELLTALSEASTVIQK
jgi:thymidylate kinase